MSGILSDEHQEPRGNLGGRIMGDDIHATAARKAAQKAIREADRAEAEAWSLRMEGYGGLAQPSPTIDQCLAGGGGGSISSAFG